MKGASKKLLMNMTEDVRTVQHLSHNLLRRENTMSNKIQSIKARLNGIQKTLDNTPDDQKDNQT